MSEDTEEQAYEDAEQRAEINADVAEEYGSPMPEEKLNQFKITHDAINRKNTVRTTFLSKQELGRPLFSVRFYLDCAEICKKYNSKLIEQYFRDKVKTITDSGMSNEGFIMKLNVTNRRDVSRKYERKVEPDKENAP